MVSLTRRTSAYCQHAKRATPIQAAANEASRAYSAADSNEREEERCVHLRADLLGGYKIGRLIGPHKQWTFRRPSLALARLRVPAAACKFARADVVVVVGAENKSIHLT